MWRGLGNVFPILVAPLTHDIKEQHAPLSDINHVFHC
jgi:hypothetical protein